MPRNWKRWLKQNAPVASHEASVGSTSWQDLRAKRDRQHQWINDIPKLPKGPRIYLEGDEEGLEEASDAKGVEPEGRSAI